MENNALFATVLRTLGFTLYSTSARVHSSASPNGDVGTSTHYYGFAYHVNIVTIANTRYLVDVGFGAGGATRPIPLDDGRVHLDIRPSQEVRLRFGTIPESESDKKLWILERRNRKEQEWSPNYCFHDDVEFLPADFIMMNHFTSSSSKTFFAYTILAVKFILSEDGEEIVGEIVLIGSRLFQRIEGRKEIEIELKSEEERIEALQKWYGITLSEHEQSGIAGMVTMLGH